MTKSSRSGTRRRRRRNEWRKRKRKFKKFSELYPYQQLPSTLSLSLVLSVSYKGTSGGEIADQTTYG